MTNKKAVSRYLQAEELLALLPCLDPHLAMQVVQSSTLLIVTLSPVNSQEIDLMVMTNLADSTQLATICERVLQHRDRYFATLESELNDPPYSDEEQAAIEQQQLELQLRDEPTVEDITPSPSTVSKIVSSMALMAVGLTKA